MTHMTAGAIGPDSSTQRLEHIKLFQIDARNAVCVFITNSAHTETKNFRFEEDIPFSDIETCTDILNKRLKGTLICDLPEKMQDVKPDLSIAVKRHELLFTAFVKAFVNFASESVYFSGKDKLLYQPEFEDITKLKQLMQMFDDSSVWKDIHSSKNAVAITTKKGGSLTWYGDLAIARKKFKVNDTESGELMVVGPSRMDYSMVMNMLQYAAKLIEKMYSTGGNENE
jgi:heat-inducible transcriptional repressor